jgi:hypothetical protein
LEERVFALYAARFEFGLFNGHDDRRDAYISLRAVEHGCAMLYDVNVDEMLAYGQSTIPPLYQTRVYYRSPDDRCGDVWQDALSVLDRGYGDCKSLACYRAAELTVFHKRPARPFVRRRWLEHGFALYQVVVAFSDGSFEDPSELLGMPSASGA